MMLDNLYVSEKEINIIKSAIANGAHTVGYYDSEGTFFYIFQNSRPNEKYSYSLSRGFDYAVARYDGVKDIFLFD